MIHPVRLAVCDVMNITLQRQKPMASNSSSWMRMRLAIIKSGGEHRLARGKSNNTDVSDDNKSQQFSPSDANERRIKKKQKQSFQQQHRPRTEKWFFVRNGWRIYKRIDKSRLEACNLFWYARAVAAAFGRMCDIVPFERPSTISPYSFNERTIK